MDWTAVFSATALSTIVSTSFSGFLVTIFTERFKASVKSEYDLKLEQSKVDFKHQSDLELERFKNGLVAQAALKQISFQSLQDKRAVVLADVYNNATGAMRALAAYTAAFELTSGPSREERREKAYNLGVKFTEHFRANRIYFPKSVAEDLERISNHLMEHFNHFYLSIDSTENPPAKEWNAIAAKVRVELDGSNGLLSKIENHFRLLLGDV